MPTVRLVISTTKRLAPSVSDALFAAGAGGLEERPGKAMTLVAYGESEAELKQLWKRAARALGAALPRAELPRVKVEVDEAEAWRTDWTQHLRPVALTRRLVLAPTTCEAPALTRRQKLVFYQPALAFGDGDHATTRLAARAIEAHYRRAPGGALLDIGAGTGVLSFVAVLSGARRAIGTDIAAEAVEAAQRNAALNGLTRSTRFLDVRARLSGGPFDLCVLNIELRPLLEVLGRLPPAARRAERLHVTGFLDSQLKEVRGAVLAAGFTPRRVVKEGGWRLIVADKT